MDRKLSSGCVVGRGEGVTSGMVRGFLGGVGGMSGEFEGCSMGLLLCVGVSGSVLCVWEGRRRFLF